MPRTPSHPVRMFLSEAAQSLAAWEHACRHLEQDLSESTIAGLAQVLRGIGSYAVAVDLAPVASYLQAVEEIVQAMAQRRLAVTARSLDVLIDAQDALLAWVLALREDVHAAAPEDCLAVMERIAALTHARSARRGRGADGIDAA